MTPIPTPSRPVAYVLYRLQMSMRSIGQAIEDRMPGMENPPELKEEKVTIDLWKLSLKDHVEIWRQATKDYKESFYLHEDENKPRKTGSGEGNGDTGTDPASFSLESIQANVRRNLAAMEESLEGTGAESNLKDIRKNVSANLGHMAEEVDWRAVDAKLDSVEKVVAKAKMEGRDLVSDKALSSTVVSNLEELQKLAELGKQSARHLTRDDVNTARTIVEDWMADKLMVGREMMTAFVVGYREGLKEEISLSSFQEEIFGKKLFGKKDDAPKNKNEEKQKQNGENSTDANVSSSTHSSS